MKYLLDTDTIVFFLRGKFNIVKKINEVGIENCFISEITIAELKFGAIKSKNFQKHTKEVYKIEELFDRLSIYDVFDEYARERFRLQKAGTLIPDFDLLIGVTSTVFDLILVTNNVRHFQRIKNIKLENWTSSIHNEFL